GLVINPFLELFDHIEANNAVDHPAPLGRGHGAESLDLALVRRAGRVKNLQSEAQYLGDLDVEHRRTGGNLGVALIERLIPTIADHLVGLAPGRERKLDMQGLVVLGLAAQGGLAEQGIAYELEDEALACLIG